MPSRWKYANMIIFKPLDWSNNIFFLMVAWICLEKDTGVIAFILQFLIIIIKKYYIETFIREIFNIYVIIFIIFLNCPFNILNFSIIFFIYFFNILNWLFYRLIKLNIIGKNLILNRKFAIYGELKMLFFITVNLIAYIRRIQ
jgi:hypothetical protein